MDWVANKLEREITQKEISGGLWLPEKILYRCDLFGVIDTT